MAKHDDERDQPFNEHTTTDDTLAARPSNGSASVHPRLLDEFARDLEASGVVGEQRAGKLLFLAITTRVFERPVCVIVKGPSAGGKSHLVNKVLSFAPPEAYQTLTAMSERALVYSTEDLRHKVLVIQEAAGLTGKTGIYIVRSLISEGRVNYLVTERNPDTGRFEGRPITREGPTGLVLTTTKIKIDAETETRLLTIPIDDSIEQTQLVLASIGAGRVGKRSEPDRQRWHRVQQEVAKLDPYVIIPYAQSLTSIIPAIALRLKRDIGQLMTLIAAHALLNHAGRERDDEGHIIATLDDYAAVYDLVNDLFSEGVARTVKPNVRETVETVARLIGEKGGSPEDTATVRDVADSLGLDKSAASRRIDDATEAGYLINEEEREGRPAKLRLGDPMPEDRGVLPSPDNLHRAWDSAK